jgi:pimeloyl-ACP methyl ester carboxylesterase
MGGAMGILMADAERDRVERLVLTSLCLFTSQAQRRLFKVVVTAFRVSLALRKTPLAKAPFFAERMASRYFHQPPEDPKWVKQLYEDFLGLDGASAIACASGAIEPAIDEAAARLQAPTLMIVCRQDDLMPMLNVEHTASLIPDCRVHWMDGSGHLPMLERPDEYVQLLQEFLARLRLRPTSHGRLALRRSRRGPG